MVQLTLIDAPQAQDLASEIDSLVRRWAAAVANASYAAEAAKVTGARFAAWGARPLDHDERARVAAYFAAVVRRRVLGMRDPAAAAARRRLARASIEADLRSAGWDRARAAAEASRAVGDAPVSAGA